MLKYILRRFSMMILVLFGISILLFTIFNLSPGDPAALILGPGVSKADIQKLRDEMGLDLPFLVRYVNYLSGALRLDFGRSYKTALPVFQELLPRIPVTLIITTFAMLISILLGIPVGVISAVKQNTIFDRMGMFLTLILTSMPPFWLGLMLLFLFSLKLNLLPATSSDSWVSYILPCVTLSSRSTAIIARMIRATMLEVMRQDYIRTAKSKGASRFCIVKNHALKNAMIPVITIIGMNFGFALGGVALIEAVFTMNGVGIMMVEAVRTKDFPITMAVVLILGIAFSLINIFVDILNTIIDPRLRTQWK